MHAGLHFVFRHFTENLRRVLYLLQTHHLEIQRRKERKKERKEHLSSHVTHGLPTTKKLASHP
jgi:hypothetical protein